MSEKRFSKLSSSIDYFDVWDSVEEKGYTVDEVVDLLNNYEIENNKLTQKIKNKNKYQQVLEAKIRRLKNRVKILEKAEGWQN